MALVEVWENILNSLMKSFEIGEISDFNYSSFTIALVDPDRCSKLYGQCKKRCSKHVKQIEICLSPSKICCIERVFEDDLS
ncbi:beta-defensin 114 [Mesoplodon densirostris]|uniref:beta-defensin 114 n=1 Tax=Mesoplodon densirostris TaxID=48708 RepID=UPI0028DD324B|nr:beta-defensin 114 [Mesoplodon densirostris]